VQDIILVLGAAALVATLFHLVSLPPIVAFFSAGALIGPSALGWIESPPRIEVMTEVAAVLLMFTIGLEFSLKELSTLKRPLLILGLGQVLGSILIFSGILAFFVNFPTEKAIFWSFIITLSSTAVVIKMLSDHRDFESPHGKSSFAILIFQDFAVIPMILMIPFLARQSGSNVTGLFDSLLPILLLVVIGTGLLYFIGRSVLPKVLHRVVQTKNREVFFFFMVFLVAVLSSAFHFVGLSYSMGAFIAGILLAGSSYGRQATAEFKPLRDAFLGVFFVTVGMLLDLNFLVLNLHKVFVIGTLVLGLKATIIFLLVWLSGSSGSVARTVAIFIFQMGEFSFILADQGFKLGLIQAKELQYFLAVAIISLATTPLVYRLMPFLSDSAFFNRWIPGYIRRLGAFVRTKTLKALGAATLTISGDHKTNPDVVIVGFGVAGRALAKVLVSLKIPYCVIESNGDTVKQFSQAEPIVFGDAASPDILEAAGIMSAKICVIVTSGVSTLAPVLNTLRQLRADIQIIARTNYLLDVEKVRTYSPLSLVVSEFETTLETIVRVLTQCNTDPDLIQEFTEDLRAQLEQHDPSLSLR